MSANTAVQASRRPLRGADLVDALLCVVAVLCAVAGYLMYFNTLTALAF